MTHTIHKRRNIGKGEEYWVHPITCHEWDGECNQRDMAWRPFRCPMCGVKLDHTNCEDESQ